MTNRLAADMRNRKWKYKSNSVIIMVLALCVVFGVASCTQEREPCYTPTIASLNIECVHYTSDTATTVLDTALPKAIFGALTNNGVKAVIYPQTANFTISLSSVANSCQWIMSTDSVAYPFDTLSFFYQRKLQFLSNACGFAYFYSIDSVHFTHNQDIDSIQITNTSVTNNVNTKHLKIFIHPDF